ncbi:hypothetical protein [Carboxylicivirga sp. RSCT41]
MKKNLVFLIISARAGFKPDFLRVSPGLNNTYLLRKSKKDPAVIDK